MLHFTFRSYTRKGGKLCHKERAYKCHTELIVESKRENKSWILFIYRHRHYSHMILNIYNLAIYIIDYSSKLSILFQLFLPHYDIIFQIYCEFLCTLTIESLLIWTNQFFCCYTKTWSFWLFMFLYYAHENIRKAES